MSVNTESGKIKVLHILGSPGIGGIEKLVYDLSLIQKSDELIEPGIYFSLTSFDSEIKLKFEETGIDIFYGGFKNAYDMSLSKHWNTYKIFRKYDLLHFHTFNPLVALTGAFSSGKKVFTDHGVHGLGRRPGISDKLKLIMESIFLNKSVDYIIFNSTFTKDASFKRFNIKKTRNIMIYNGVSEHLPDYSITIDQSIMDKVNGKFVVGTTSRFASFKRVDRLIQGFYKFQMNRDTVLLLVGDGPEMEHLKKLADSFNLRDKVIFAGFRTSIANYQNIMDVCVFPSQSEPFGLVAVEGLMLGKPVVVFSDGGGIVEIIKQLSPDDVVEDVDELADRLIYYYRTDNDKDAMDHRINYAKTFSSSKMANKYRKVYLDLYYN